MDDIKDDLDRIEGKLDEHTKILSSVDKTLALQAQQLEQHMRRTELAEENISMLREDFKPIQRHVVVVGALIKMISIIAALAGASYYSIQVLKFIFKV